MKPLTILGVDPGSTTGWCAYDATARRVIAADQFYQHEAPLAVIEAARAATHVVIERPVVYHGSPPAMGDACIVAGRLFQQFAASNPQWLTRAEVKKRLRVATECEFPVQKDRDVWFALKLLHGGEGCDKKGGPLHGVRSHARAALAAAVAFALGGHVVGERSAETSR